MCWFIHHVLICLIYTIYFYLCVLLSYCLFMFLYVSTSSLVFICLLALSIFFSCLILNSVFICLQDKFWLKCFKANQIVDGNSRPELDIIVEYWVKSLRLDPGIIDSNLSGITTLFPHMTLVLVSSRRRSCEWFK
jgi:hypothetical protein